MGNSFGPTISLDGHQRSRQRSPTGNGFAHQDPQIQSESLSKLISFVRIVEVGDFPQLRRSHMHKCVPISLILKATSMSRLQFSAMFNFSSKFLPLFIFLKFFIVSINDRFHLRCILGVGLTCLFSFQRFPI